MNNKTNPFNWQRNVLKEEPKPTVWNAIKDVTEQDIVMMRYRQLQSEHAARQLLKNRIKYR